MLTQVDPEWLPTFDDVLVGVLKSFGVSGAVVIGLILLAFSLKSWLDGIRDSYRLASRIATTVPATVSRLGRRGAGSAAAVIMLVALAQALTLGIAYILGNFVSVLLSFPTTASFTDPDNPAVGRLEAFEVAWGSGAIFGMVSPDLLATLELDGWSVGVVAVAALGYVGSYFSARKRSSNTGSWGLLSGLPCTLQILVSFFSVPLILLSESGTQDRQDGVSLLISGVVSVIYVAMFVAGARGSGMVVAAWRATSPTPA
ncbi:MAG TPA: hypothetical protein VGD67_27765 [Pseudonocardiaceae bacterium]